MSRRKTNRIIEHLQLWDLDCVFRGMHMRNLYNLDTWHRWFQKSRHRFGRHVLINTCGICKLIHRCWCSSRGAGCGVGIRCVTGRIRSIEMNFSVQLSEKTFGPDRVHVSKEVEGSVECEELFRNPSADKSAASTLPSGLLEAFEVGARRIDKTLQMPMKPTHKRVPIRARREHKPTAVVRPCRANQGKASIQDITLSQNGYGSSRCPASWHNLLLMCDDIVVKSDSPPRGNWRKCALDITPCNTGPDSPSFPLSCSPVLVSWR